MEKIKGGLIVSCQALPNEPLHSSYVMSKMATAVIEGGACGIRANSVSDITEIKKVTDVPIIGIIKKEYGDCPVFITPTLKEVEELINIGVEIIALDGTKRDRPDGVSLDKLVSTIKSKYPDQKLMADVSTVEEAIFCERLGFDFIGTTLVGYTEYTKGDKPLEVLKKVVKNVKTKVIAEGNINTPNLVKQAYESGAYSVVVGSMITRPQIITKTFVDAINQFKNDNTNNKYFAIDIGGTAVKYGVVNKNGEVLSQSEFPTGEYDNVNALLEKLYCIVEKELNNISGIGISCTGKIDDKSGVITGGVSIMKDWINTPLKKLFVEKFGVDVYVNNDVKCIGLSELWLGEGLNSDNFVCVAIGTGVGGAIINKREIVCGENNFAGEIGHTILNFDGPLCKCGKKGCYELYGSMSALVRNANYLTDDKLTGKEIFERAKNNDLVYVNLVNDWINNVAKGIANIVLLLNPKTIVIGGAVSVQKELFLDKLDLEVKKYLNDEFKNIKFVPARNFNNAGMLGAVYGVINNL